MDSTAQPSLDRIRGCLLGGAVGDALGSPVEFDTLAEIHQKFGSQGVRRFAPAFGRVGAITDDTQMTLFTAEGLIRARSRWLERGTTMPLTMLHRAYLRWLVTQGETPTCSGFPGMDIDLFPGWLSGVRALYAQRAPGSTCVNSLGQPCAGTRERPMNDSKGCGGVMRVAPIGLVVADPAAAFDLACGAAAITHGHPTGYLAAGALACLVNRLAYGVALHQAVGEVLDELKRHPRAEEVVNAVEAAVRAAGAGPPCAHVVERLGGGWIAEEALGIALYCALTAGTFDEGVILAVNHGGDSDSTGAITGNILGTMLGTQAIGAHWLRDLEMRDEIETMAQDLSTWFHQPDFKPTPDDFVRYPPN